MELPELIPNAALTASQIPDLQIPRLDPQNFNGGGAPGRNDAEWEALWTFALTFDGERYFGADDEAAVRLDAFSDSVRRAFAASGSLPRIDLALLRACLYIEQRRACKWGFAMTEECPPEFAEYYGALLNDIRAEVSS